MRCSSAHCVHVNLLWSLLFSKPRFGLNWCPLFFENGSMGLNKILMTAAIVGTRIKKYSTVLSPHKNTVTKNHAILSYNVGKHAQKWSYFQKILAPTIESHIFKLQATLEKIGVQMLSYWQWTDRFRPLAIVQGQGLDFGIFALPRQLYRMSPEHGFFCNFEVAFRQHTDYETSV